MSYATQPHTHDTHADEPTEPGSRNRCDRGERGGQPRDTPLSHSRSSSQYGSVGSSRLTRSSGRAYVIHAGSTGSLTIERAPTNTNTGRSVPVTWCGSAIARHSM